MIGLDLAASAIALVISTGLLLFVGRIPLSGWAWRVIAAIGVSLGAAVYASANASPLPITVAIWIVVVMFLEPPRWYAVGATFFAALVVCSLTYAIYLIGVTQLLTNGLLSLVLGLALLALELGAMALILGGAFEMIDALCSPRRDAVLPPPPDRWPVVCLQVPTYNEPPELVIETIRSLVALDYPALRVQVIDNNTTEASLWWPLQDECDRLQAAGHRVEFVHLADWPGFKAGALNWGLRNLQPDVEIVGVVDADYLVDPAWLKSTVPHFNDPRVAFVQTPQDYRDWESSAFYRACYVGFAYFFGVGMVSRARRNAIIFAGTMGLIRRSALEQVGGWDERIITEDAEVSLRVLARGARCVYVPKAFGKGIMPLTYEGLRKQRFRWAFGGIQILRRHWRTIFGPRRHGLTLGQRYDHLMGALWWFNDALTLGFTVFVAATALGVALGRPFAVQRLTGLGLVLPLAFLVLNLVRYLWALRASTGATAGLAMEALRVNLSLSWVIALACFRGLTQEQGVFLRTPKFAGAAAIRELRLVWVETGTAVFPAILFVAMLARAGLAPVGIALAGLLAWAAFIYASATEFALSDPSRTPISEALGQKMALEMAPIGKIVRAPGQAGSIAVLLVALSLGVVVAAESGRAPVRNLPFREVPAGPLVANPVQPSFAPTPSPSGSPSPSASVVVSQPTPTLPPAATPVPTTPPTPAPTPAATPVATHPPAATPGPT